MIPLETRIKAVDWMRRNRPAEFSAWFTNVLARERFMAAQEDRRRISGALHRLADRAARALSLDRVFMARWKAYCATENAYNTAAGIHPFSNETES